MSHLTSRVLRLPVALTLLVVAALAVGVAGTASARTVWLCKPGQTPDPCNVSLATTVFSPTLHALNVVHPARVKKPVIDCFYVYPTVSDQKTTLANLHVDPEERSIALYQAARYAQYCRVFAPMYRQVTVPALESGNRESPKQLAIPVSDVRAAFATYLRRFNHGHGFVLIGHSQGSLVLEQLIAKDIDANPAVRKRLVSAILLGGNVLVKRHKTVGGSFKHVPACRSATQLGCVIAFSTFDQPPPANSIFGRTTVPGDQVLCTNPAALGGGAATADPIFPSAPFAPGTLIAAGIALLKLTQPAASTTWVSEPNAYRAQCSSAGGANVLQVTALNGAQTATPSPDPTWGLHLLDANIVLGNLLTVVRSEAAAYAARPSAPLAPGSATG
ncbi:MAG: DUF3089 domain-containing protein [Solirubrobacteraceae bacterium]